MCVYKHLSHELLIKGEKKVGSFNFTALMEAMKDVESFYVAINGTKLPTVFKNVSNDSYMGVVDSLVFSSTIKSTFITSISSKCPSITQTSVITPIPSDMSVTIIPENSDINPINLNAFNTEIQPVGFKTNILPLGTVVRFKYVNTYNNIETIGIVSDIPSTNKLLITYPTTGGTDYITVTAEQIISGTVFNWNVLDIKTLKES